MPSISTQNTSTNKGIAVGIIIMCMGFINSSNVIGHSDYHND